MEEKNIKPELKIIKNLDKDYYKRKNFRLSTEPCSLTCKQSLRNGSYLPLSPLKLSPTFVSRAQGKKGSVFKNINAFEKRISTMNQTVNFEARITSRQKQNIVESFRRKLQKSSRPKAQNLKPAQKMMLEFQRELKRIKRAQNNVKVDEVLDHNDRFEAFSASLTQQSSAQNEDSVRFTQGLYILCDGHGSNGKEVARFVCNNVFEKCLQKKKQNKVSKSTIIQVFSSVQRDLEYSGVDIAFSGSTCLMVIYGDREIFVANLGDSQAIMKRECRIEALSHPHIPSSQVEKERIQSVGGVVRQLEVNKGKFIGPLKIWAPGKNSWGPGIPLSRCFGNKAARRYGLISEPQIMTFEHLQDDHTIVIGSRALFESMKPETIFNLIKKNPLQGKVQICQSLAEEALKKMEGEFQKVSIILIFA